MSLFINLPLTPFSCNHWYVFCPYSFAFSRMSCKWEIRNLLSLFSLSIMLLRFIDIGALILVYQLVSWWTTRLFPVFGDHECFVCVSVYVDIGLCFSLVILRRIFGLYAKCMFSAVCTFAAIANRIFSLYFLRGYCCIYEIFAYVLLFCDRPPYQTYF